MRAWLHLAFGLIFTAGFAGCGYAHPPMMPVRADAVRIVGAPLPLSAHNAGRTRVGELTWAGGLKLTSPDTASLGGMSGIDVADDGVSFVSQSDEGGLLRGRLVLDSQGRLTGVAGATLQRLVDEQDRPYQRKIDADAEDVTLLPGGYAISYEQDHRVMRYRDAGGPGVRLPVSPQIFARPPNNGLEALSWRRGRLYEGAEDGEVWRCDPDAKLADAGACASVMPTSPFPGYSLTGLDACGDGFVAVYRRVDVFNGWRAVIAQLTPAAADGSGPWRARKLATLRRPLTRDNMEGIACTPLPGGDPGGASGWRLYLVSDDNFESFERTLLLAFDWRPTQPATAPAK